MTHFVNNSMNAKHGDKPVAKERNIVLQIKDGFDEGRGVLRGYGSVYGNIDNAGDIMAPGCFAKSINDKTASGKKFPFLYQHNWADPIGVIEVIKEDSRGLLIDVQLNLETERGRETYALVKQGAITGLSVGFLIIKDEINSQGIRTIREGKLMEVSAVTFPCNEEAQISSVKRLSFNGEPKVKFKNTSKSIDACLETITGLTKAVENDDLTEKQFKVALESISTLLTTIKADAKSLEDEPQKSADSAEDDALAKSEGAEDAAEKADTDEPQEFKFDADLDLDAKDDDDDSVESSDEDETEAKSDEDAEEEEALKSLQHSIELFVKGL